jgi:hypothetical protein
VGSSFEGTVVQVETVDIDEGAQLGGRRQNRRRSYRPPKPVRRPGSRHW